MANSFVSASNAITTSGTTLYTCPASTTAMVHSLFVTNISGSAGSVTISHSTASGNNKATGVSGATNYRIGFSVPVNQNETLFYDKPIVLNAGDSLVLTANANSTFEAFLSILLMT